jgi:excisionase family DNA binding protein
MTAEPMTTIDPAPPAASQKLLLRVDEARALLSLNRTQMYRLLMAGSIYSFKEGAIRLIPRAELDAYVERRTAEGRAAARASRAKSRAIPPRAVKRAKGRIVELSRRYDQDEQDDPDER